MHGICASRCPQAAEAARTRLRAGQGGFTLVELLVVMVILSILMAGAITVYTGQKELARETVTEAHLDQASKLIIEARDDTESTMLMITGDADGNSGNQCDRTADGQSFQSGNVKDPTWLASNCGKAWLNMVTKLSVHADSLAYTKQVFTDGWGRGILADENENDGVWGCGRNDFLYSGGRTGRMSYFKIQRKNDDKSLSKLVPLSDYCDSSLPKSQRNNTPAM